VILSIFNRLVKIQRQIGSFQRQIGNKVFQRQISRRKRSNVSIRTFKENGLQWFENFRIHDLFSFSCHYHQPYAVTLIEA